MKRFWKRSLIFFFVLLFALPMPLVRKEPASSLEVSAENDFPEIDPKLMYSLWWHMRHDEGDIPIYIWWYDWKTETIDEVWTADEFIELAGLPEEVILYKGEEVPVVCAQLSKEEIERLVAMEEDFVMDYWGGTTPPYIYYPYTSTNARIILQAMVGKAEGIVLSYNREFDVDADGEFSTTDARLALQHAVGKITIAWPYYTTFPL